MQAQLIIAMAVQILSGGLKALDQIVAIVNKYGGADKVPLDEWKAMFKRSKARHKPYWDWFNPTDA